MHAKDKDMRVKTLNIAEQNKCRSGSWLAHWEKLSGQNAFMCFTEGCINMPSVGGHVQKDSTTDKNWYVIPLCTDCSKKSGQDLDIWDTAKFVSAKETETSGVAASTPRNFTPWALERFPERRLVR
jgi:hypothetical protein